MLIPDVEQEAAHYALMADRDGGRLERRVRRRKGRITISFYEQCPFSENWLCVWTCTGSDPEAPAPTGEA